MSASAREILARRLCAWEDEFEWSAMSDARPYYHEADRILAALSAAGFVIVRAHKWFIPPGIEYECCRDCGIVRRGDDRHRPCIGPVRVGLRHHEPLKDEYTEESAMLSAAEGKK